MTLAMRPLCSDDEDIYVVRTLKDGRKLVGCRRCPYEWEHGEPSAGAKGRRRRAEKSGAKRAGQKNRTDTKRGKTAGGEPRTCAECGARSRYGRYRLCLRCGIQAGFRVCSRCGRYFQPETPVSAKKKTKCKACNKRRRGSVWVTASAGSPGLGRRR